MSFLYPVTVEIVTMRTEAQLEAKRAEIVKDLWVNEGYSSGEIAAIVRVSESEAQEIINRRDRDT